MSSIKLEITCEDPWFTLIKEGQKPVEGRKGLDKYKELKKGDIVRFHCPGSGQSFLATVLKVESFKSIVEYLNGVGLQKALPNTDTIEEGVKIYTQWSSEEQIKALGFVGIWIQTL